eukprot:1160442-Pelagomonas_calceolata.AAC.4
MATPGLLRWGSWTASAPQHANWPVGGGADDVLPFLTLPVYAAIFMLHTKEEQSHSAACPSCKASMPACAHADREEH